jgi:hypothetical protein
MTGALRTTWPARIRVPFNDTYTRTFAGRALSTERSGEERIAPELLAETLLRAR